MSYILDALRRAQAERERGQVPGLEARPVSDLAPAPPAHGAGTLRAALALGAVALVIAAVAAWRALAPATVTSPAPALPATAATPAAPSATPVARAPVPAPTEAPQLPTVVSSPPASPAPAAAVPTTPPAVAAVAPATAAAVPVPAASSTVRATKLAQLPPELRRELPPLTVGGAIWSENAASRFLIIDGQVLREGEPVATGVVLERIAQKAAWLRWRDWRIELSY